MSLQDMTGRIQDCMYTYMSLLCSHSSDTGGLCDIHLYLKEIHHSYCFNIYIYIYIYNIYTNHILITTWRNSGFFSKDSSIVAASFHTMVNSKFATCSSINLLQQIQKIGPFAPTLENVVELIYKFLNNP